MPVHMDGTSAAHMVVSETTITSQREPVPRRSQQAAKCGEPDSSSPSISSLSVTGGASRAGGGQVRAQPEGMEQDLALVVGRAAAQQPPVPLMGWNGGLCHSSSGSTGCTS